MTYSIDIWEITRWYSYTSFSETRWNSKFEIRPNRCSHFEPL